MTGHLAYRPDIDGLRAVAVLAVVAYHAFPGMPPGGFVGVDVFFVISGYLISTIIFAGLRDGSFRFGEFYRRRIRRIFPALLVVLGTCLAFGWYRLLADEYRELGKHVAAGIGFVSNFVLWGEAGYFDREAHAKPLLHLWSLGIEEQFYLAWPLLAWLAWKCGRRLLWLTAAVFAASVAASLYGVAHDPVGAFYSPLTRAWELAAGGLLAWGVAGGHLRPGGGHASTSNLVSVAGAALLAFSIVAIDSSRSFPGAWALPPVLGTILLIAAGAQAWFNRVVLSNRVLVWFGLISYPLYLWHWPMLSLGNIDGRGTSAGYRAAAVGLAIVLAWLTWRLVERPIRRSSGWRAAAFLLVGGIAVAAVGAWAYRGDGLPGREVVRTSLLTPKVMRQLTGANWAFVNNERCTSTHEYPGWERMDYWFCMQSNRRSPTLLILGTSFANQLYPGFAANPLLRHHTVLSIGGCDVAAPRTNDMPVPPSSPCSGARPGEQQDLVARIVEQNPSVRFAVLAGTRVRSAEPEYVDRLRARIDGFERRGVRVIIFNPHLRIPFHPRTCFRTAASPRICEFPVALRQALDADFQPLVDAISQSHPDVLFFDQNDIFCDGDRCSYVHGGKPLHRDGTPHLSEYASVQVQQHFTRWARTHVPEILDPAHVGRDAQGRPLH